MKDKKKVCTNLNIKTTTGEKFEIPVDGNLGLLALGDIGLIAWRKRKLEFVKKQAKEKISSGAW